MDAIHYPDRGVAAPGATATAQRVFTGSRIGMMALGIAVIAGAIAVLAPATRHAATRPGASDVASPAHHHGAAVHAQAAAPGSGAEAARPATTVRPVSCERLPHVPGKSITTAVVGFPPGAYSPRHHHPGSVTAFVLKGAVRSQLAGGPIDTFTVGQTWFEPPGTIHLFAENASATEPAELLATFIADDDCGPLTVFE
jgi:quercetin dioxygenase-like cupin family protein